MSSPPRILRTRTLARTRVFEIEAVDLEFANGTAVQYERLRGAPQGAVLVVPIRDDGNVLLIREYAAGMERYELGLPKGSIEPGEDILVAANREIQEEVGYAARRLSHLTTLTLAPGYSSQHSHVVLARDLYASAAPGDEPEPLQVVPVPLAEITAVIMQQKISEARSIAALFMVLHHLQTGSP